MAIEKLLKLSFQRKPDWYYAPMIEQDSKITLMGYPPETTHHNFGQAAEVILHTDISVDEFKEASAFHMRGHTLIRTYESKGEAAAERQRQKQRKALRSSEVYIETMRAVKSAVENKGRRSRLELEYLPFPIVMTTYDLYEDTDVNALIKFGHDVGVPVVVVDLDEIDDAEPRLAVVATPFSEDLAYLAVANEEPELVIGWCQEHGASIVGVGRDWISFFPAETSDSLDPHLLELARSFGATRPFPTSDVDLAPPGSVTLFWDEYD